MKKTKKTLLMTISVIVGMALLFGISVSAASAVTDFMGNGKGHHSREERMNDDNNRAIAKIDSINGSTITLTVGEIEKPEKDATTQTPEGENEETEKTMPSLADSFVAGSEKLTLTIPEDVDTEGLTAGTIVMVSYNDNNEVVRIHDVSEGRKGFGKEGKSMNVGTVDSVSSDSITITLGSLNKPEKTDETTEIPDQSEMENFKPSENYVAGTEKITLTVEDSSLLENIKDGDIVTFKYNDENVLQRISLLDEMPQKGDKMNGTRSGKSGRFSDTEKSENGSSNAQNEETKTDAVSLFNL